MFQSYHQSSLSHMFLFMLSWTSTPGRCSLCGVRVRKRGDLEYLDPPRPHIIWTYSNIFQAHNFPMCTFYDLEGLGMSIPEAPCLVHLSTKLCYFWCECGYLFHTWSIWDFGSITTWAPWQSIADISSYGIWSGREPLLYDFFFSHLDGMIWESRGEHAETISIYQEQRIYYLYDIPWHCIDDMDTHVRLFPSCSIYAMPITHW